jgi:hypothetical protein
MTRRGIARFSIGLGILVTCAVGLHAIYRFYEWTQTGDAGGTSLWQFLTRIGIAIPPTDWSGGQRVLGWLLATDTDSVLVILGLAIIAIGVQLLDEKEQFFFRCPICGQSVDTRKTSNVIYHEQANHVRR